MRIGSSPWLELLADGIRHMGLTPHGPALDKCTRLAQLLVTANKRVNLTAITDPREVALKHLVDSLAPLPHVPQGARVADIGSGAGFPGLVMAIFRPDMELASVEAVRKKSSFQRHAVLELGLTNVKTYNIRAEKWSEQGEKAVFFNMVVCRALAGLDTILDWASPMLNPGGIILAMKGREETENLSDLSVIHKNGMHFQTQIIPYTLPGEDAARNLVLLRADP